ncbi:MAG TPA: hypothetical protein EYP85_13125, partial [Armatimonadetes bacterium]|nr:hypothetical protein [Armatimonadota bacterium]
MMKESRIGVNLFISCGVHALLLRFVSFNLQPPAAPPPLKSEGRIVLRDAELTILPSLPKQTEPPPPPPAKSLSSPRRKSVRRSSPPAVEQKGTGKPSPKQPAIVAPEPERKPQPPEVVPAPRVAEIPQPAVTPVVAPTLAEPATAPRFQPQPTSKATRRRNPLWEWWNKRRTRRTEPKGRPAQTRIARRPAGATNPPGPADHPSPPTAFGPAALLPVATSPQPTENPVLSGAQGLHRQAQGPRGVGALGEVTLPRVGRRSHPTGEAAPGRGRPRVEMPRRTQAGRSGVALTPSAGGPASVAAPLPRGTKVGPWGQEGPSAVGPSSGSAPTGDTGGGWGRLHG